MVNMKSDCPERKYQEMREEILPDMDEQTRIWKMIEEKAAERKKKRIYRLKAAGGTAAAVFVLALGISHTNLAKELHMFLEKHFYPNKDIEQDIYHNVYAEEDEHIRMQIPEQFSDGACVYMDIVYEALDEKGAQWLKELDFITHPQRVRLTDLDEDNTGGYSEVLEEYTEDVPENQRRFIYSLIDYTGDYHLKNSKHTMFYPMYRRQGIGTIELKCNLENFSWRLKPAGASEGDAQGATSPSKFYEPNYLTASKMCFGIFGINRGAFVKKKDEYNEYQEYLTYSDEFQAQIESGELDLKIVFTMKNGAVLAVSWDRNMWYSEAENAPSGSDFLVDSGFFRTDADVRKEKYRFIDPEELAAVEIDGVRYTLTREE